jgi:hypothetical protein
MNGGPKFPELTRTREIIAQCLGQRLDLVPTARLNRIKEPLHFSGHFDLKFAGYGVDDLAPAARKLVDFIGDDFSRRSRSLRTRAALRSPSQTGAGRIGGRRWSSRIGESWIGGRAAVLAEAEKRNK